MANQHGAGYSKWLDASPAPTVFNRLEGVGLSWRIYFDALQFVTFTGVIQAPEREKFWKTHHFATMEQFEADSKITDLPDYAFI